MSDDENPYAAPNLDESPTAVRDSKIPTTRMPVVLIALTFGAILWAVFMLIAGPSLLAHKLHVLHLMGRDKEIGTSWVGNGCAAIMLFALVPTVAVNLMWVAGSLWREKE